MKFIRMAILALATTLCAGVASAQLNKEQYVLCSGTGANCTTVAPTVNWGQDTYVEVTLETDTGCPPAATYQVFASNAGGGGNLVTTLNTAGVKSLVFIPQQWYLNWHVVSSDLTGCTALSVILYVVRAPLR